MDFMAWLTEKLADAVGHDIAIAIVIVMVGLLLGLTTR
jgi:hypothetical protein